MEINALATTKTAVATPADRPAPNIENQEPKKPEAVETAQAENKEAYKVNISAEALKAQENQSVNKPGPEGSDNVQAYTNTGKIAG